MSSASYKNFTDEELIALYKKSGELNIVGELFSRYSTLVFGVCLKYLKDREESRDAVMQIFEKLIALLNNHEVNQFKGWLYVTARNHCLMQLRSRKGKNFEEISPFLVESGTEMHLDDDSVIEANLGKLAGCIETLVQEQKICVQLFYIDQKCYQEISDSTGYDMNKVKSYIQNGKRNLKICMEKNG